MYSLALTKVDRNSSICDTLSLVVLLVLGWEGLRAAAELARRLM